MIYLYNCLKCDKIFEVEKSMFAVNKHESCPKCKDSEMMRVYTAPATKTGDGFKK